MQLLFFLFLLTTSSLAIGNELICFFRPPDQWAAADSSTLSPLVKVGFFGPSSQIGFCPSINLAEEKVNCSLKKYLDIVKKIHTSNRHKVWTYLGPITTLAGDGALTQIDLPSPSGPLRLLQLIFIKDNKAYILTAASLKKEFVQLLPLFQKSFQSLQLKDNLYQAILDEKRRKKAQRLYTSAETAVVLRGAFSEEMPEWKTFQTTLIQEYTDLGSYWQALVISGAYRHFQSLVTVEKVPSVRTSLSLIKKIEVYLMDLELKTQPYSNTLKRPQALHFSKKHV